MRRLCMLGSAAALAITAPASAASPISGSLQSNTDGWLANNNHNDLIVGGSVQTDSWLGSLAGARDLAETAATTIVDPLTGGFADMSGTARATWGPFALSVNAGTFNFETHVAVDAPDQADEGQLYSVSSAWSFHFLAAGDGSFGLHYDISPATLGFPPTAFDYTGVRYAYNFIRNGVAAASYELFDLNHPVFNGDIVQSIDFGADYLVYIFVEVQDPFRDIEGNFTPFSADSSFAANWSIAETAPPPPPRHPRHRRRAYPSRGLGCCSSPVLA